jgi:hypothetical protein
MIPINIYFHSGSLVECAESQEIHSAVKAWVEKSSFNEAKGDSTLHTNYHQKLNVVK